MSGQNIGDLLNSRGHHLGLLPGRLRPDASRMPTAPPAATAAPPPRSPMTDKADYIPHHQPFQYYTSTQNLKHTRPTSAGSVGMTATRPITSTTSHDFFDAINAGNFPAVSFLKAPGYQDGHAGYSDPLDEQTFVATVINFLQKQKDWENTAVVIAYDDSDGWYDHQMGPIVNQSATAMDALTGPALRNWTRRSAGSPSACPGPLRLWPASSSAGHLALCEAEFVDHTVTDQTSILRFIEDNWLAGSASPARSTAARALNPCSISRTLTPPSHPEHQHRPDPRY